MKTWLIPVVVILAGARGLWGDTLVSVDTSGLAGTAAQLAFDFIDGGPPLNTITISSFLTDGTLGGVFPSGGASGTLLGTVVLSDSDFFNEYLTDITLGSSFSFVFSATANGPDAGSLPDAFSLFLIDPNTGLPLFGTADPSGADSLVTLNIDGSPTGALSVYSTSVKTGPPPAASAVPEPSMMWMLGVGLVPLLRRARLFNAA
ncbi:MAG TPA: NF038129 family PEP-CTERM protein [Bryobacteraceae bacterium]|jgi:hypothetical protein